MPKVFPRQANERVLFSTSSLLAEKVILGDNPLTRGREHNSEAAAMPGGQLMLGVLSGP